MTFNEGFPPQKIKIYFLSPSIQRVCCVKSDTLQKGYLQGGIHLLTLQLTTTDLHYVKLVVE